MRRAVSVGIGCLANSRAGIIEALAQRRLATIPAAKLLALFKVSDKEQKPGIHAPVRQLGLPAVHLPREALLEVTARSHAAKVRLGLTSVAEAAALVGHGPPPVLIVRRIAGGGATCGLAALGEERP